MWPSRSCAIACSCSARAAARAPGASGAPPARTPATTPPSAAGGAAAAPRAAARAEHEQALAQLRDGHIEEAAALFAAAVEHDPGNAAYATDYGFALGRLGRRAEAEKLLRGAIEKDPHRVYAWVNLAEIYADDPTRWERRDSIIAFLEKGLDAIKDDQKRRFNLVLGIANFERAIGRTTAARARLEPLLARDADPPLSRAQRKRVLDLLDALALDDRAHALEDWPRPDVSRPDLAQAAAAARALDTGHASEALAVAGTLVQRYPTWARALVLRARALEASGRVDEAARDLEVAVNLAPSDAVAWRTLGKILAQHGGALEAERADEALRNALTLEPGWTDLRELRDKLARRRAIGNAPTQPGRAAFPTDVARQLYQQAEEWIRVGDPVGLGRELLDQALADSPGFVAAAVSSYALTGKLPPATLEALKDDGPGLWALAAGVRKLGQTGKKTASGDDVEALVGPLIDRAVALDVQEARFARAIARAATGDRAGALADLTAYVAREPTPEHLAEARALRAEIEDRNSPRTDAQPSPQLLARIRLLEDKPDWALRALGGPCARDVPGDRLVALGSVYEYAEQLPAARHCYELAANAGGPAGAGALQRAASLDARLPDAELRKADRRVLATAAGAHIGAAEWALARLAELEGDRPTALARIDSALALAVGTTTDGDHWVDAARAAGKRLSDDMRADASERRRREHLAELSVVIAVGAVLGLFARRRWRGRTVASALRRRPGLFPEVARSVGELRHDVLKHRASVLGMLTDPDAPRDEIVRTMTEPKPTSAVVAAIYDRIVQAAVGQGVTLRALAREPVFGALHRDLARAEALLAQGGGGAGAELAAIDERLRGPEAEALAALLQLGPRTRLDAATLSGWIASVEASARQAGGGWTAPALALADLGVDFPIEHDALAAIFMNLLRNAQAAVAGQDDARVIVRVDRARDVTGQQEVSLALGDSAAAPLTLESIEARESGRGLAIVRDLVRQWRGHMVVRADAGPFTKAVGACFPL
ncbi:MAG TPA: tetratricopeptide repeat protein, partial [Polyangia bacterium]